MSTTPIKPTVSTDCSEIVGAIKNDVRYKEPNWINNQTRLNEHNMRTLRDKLILYTDTNISKIYEALSKSVENVINSSAGWKMSNTDSSSGEVFNDYDNNLALSRYSAAFGTNCTAGSRTYSISNVDVAAKTITLKSASALSSTLKTSLHEISWEKTDSNNTQAEVSSLDIVKGNTYIIRIAADDIFKNDSGETAEIYLSLSDNIEDSSNIIAHIDSGYHKDGYIKASFIAEKSVTETDTVYVIFLNAEDDSEILKDNIELLESVELSCQVTSNYDYFGRLVNISGNEIEVTSIPLLTNDELTSLDNPETSAYLWIPSYPELGDGETVGIGAFATGHTNKASQRGSFVAGNDNTASGKYSATFGQYNKSGYCSATFGQYNNVNQWSLVGGYSNSSVAPFTFICGYSNIVTAQAASALGWHNYVNGECSFAVGRGADTNDGTTGIYSNYSFSAGQDNYISADAIASIATGIQNKVYAPYSVALGYKHTINSEFGRSFAAGSENTVNHNYSAVLGKNLITGRDNQVVVGRQNVVDDGAVFIVANGTATTGTSNAFTVKSDGKALLGSADILSDEKAVVTKKYVDDEVAKAASGKITKAIVTKVDGNKVTIDGKEDDAVENVIYMLKDNSATGSDVFFEYTLINGTLTLIGDTSTDLRDYVKSAYLSDNYYDKNNTDGKLNDIHSLLDNKADITEIPTKLSQLENDLDLDMSDYYTKDEVDDIVENVNGLSTGNICYKIDGPEYNESNILSYVITPKKYDFMKMKISLDITAFSGYLYMDVKTASKTEKVCLGDTMSGEVFGDIEISCTNNKLVKFDFMGSNRGYGKINMTDYIENITLYSSNTSAKYSGPILVEEILEKAEIDSIASLAITQLN